MLVERRRRTKGQKTVADLLAVSSECCVAVTLLDDHWISGRRAAFPEPPLLRGLQGPMASKLMMFSI